VVPLRWSFRPGAGENYKHFAPNGAEKKIKRMRVSVGVELQPRIIAAKERERQTTDEH
jgi:hypothetical protein